MSQPADETEALLQFLYIAPVGLAQTTIDGEIVMINPLSAQLLLPLSSDGALENLFAALEGIAPDLRNRTESFTAPYGTICEDLKLQISAGVPGRSEARILSLTLLKTGPDRLMAMLRDITREVARELLLRDSEAWLNAILTGITDYAVVRVDAQGRIHDWNKSIGRLTGFQPEDVVGKPYSCFYPSDSTTPERDLDRLREADASGWSMDEGWRLRADGTRFWGSAIIAPLLDHGVPHADGTVSDAEQDEPTYCLVIRDISDKREAGERIREAASCDHLTGIANRRAFFEAAEFELERWQRAPRPLSIIIFDADHFKRINDTHGHPVGDAVLRHLATVLSTTFRQIDIVARVGGEEFAILLPSTDLTDAIAVAERVRRKIAAASVDVDGKQIPYTVSGGVATMDASLAGLDALMKRADTALYAAKAAGRNRIEPAPAT